MKIKMKPARNCIFAKVSLLTVCLLLLLLMSCKTKPPVPPPGPPAPSQQDLSELDAAMNRALRARESAVNVQAEAYFPDEWKKAEADNNAGKSAGRDTLEGAKRGIASFTSAAEMYEAIAEKSGPLFAKDLEDARLALEEAFARAEQSRNDARENNASAYFPDEWETAEGTYQSGIDARSNLAPAPEEVSLSEEDSSSEEVSLSEESSSSEEVSLSEESSSSEEVSPSKEGGLTPADLAAIKAATAIFISAAESYDELAEKSRPLYASDKDEAMKNLQEATARAEQSRKDAQGVQANTYFPDDWKNAEAGLLAGNSAPKLTLAEITAAAALFVSAADMYDDLAEKSRPRFAADEAQKSLNAAIARAEKSRQAAMDVDGQTYFPNEWRNAETTNTNAKNAKKTTAEEIAAAAALYNSAADAYDVIARNSGPRFTKDKDDASRALQTAIARSEKSRKDATDVNGQTNFQREWRDAETKNTNAKNAKRVTPAEIKAAAALYNSAADAYDDIVRKNTARVAEEAQKTSQDAKTRAERARQAAIDARANVAVLDDFNRADAIYQQAVRDFNAKTFAPATDRYNQAADQFTAAAAMVNSKRSQAEEIIETAKQKSTESAAFAVNTGLALEGNNE